MVPENGRTSGSPLGQADRHFAIPAAVTQTGLRRVVLAEIGFYLLMRVIGLPAVAGALSRYSSVLDDELGGRNLDPVPGPRLTAVTVRTRGRSRR